MRQFRASASTILITLLAWGCTATPTTQPTAAPIASSTLEASPPREPANYQSPSKSGRYQALYTPSGFYMIDTETGQMWQRHFDGWVMDGSPVTRPTE